jgi:hypothetical protein
MATPVPPNATFVAQFPEFTTAPASLLTAHLTAAARRTNAEVFSSPELAEQAVLLRAVINLVKSPFARQMKLVSDDQVFLWHQELRELQRSATMGLRVFATWGLAVGSALALVSQAWV